MSQITRVFEGLKPNTKYGIKIFPISKGNHFQTRPDKGKLLVTTLPEPSQPENENQG